MVNFTDLGDIGTTLGQDLEFTNDSTIDVLGDINEEAEATNTMLECMANADQMVVDAVLILVQLQMLTVMEVHEAHVNRGRNVALRRWQAQQTPQVCPGFNKAMSDKWMEIWADPSIPQPQRGTIRQWYLKAGFAWRVGDAYFSTLNLQNKLERIRIFSNSAVTLIKVT